MQEYKVTWTIEVSAESSVEAAEKARDSARPSVYGYCL